ncbi:class I SAM-dependent methyltransferase [Sulfurivermis fontis]|uniref:class I SAM-dependent methyltransferase n=1 Tax=Sulfurivermis fontis TaxID=1972068 RepID=UPI000FD8B4DF|nr:class I SAM-dependent methyltransferase [Sulfurivermis fontis]
MSIEAYYALCAQLGLTQGIPYTPQWSAAPDFLQLIVDHVLTDKPQTIVECGSGLTTLMLARACALNGGGHVYSLENDADYAANTRSEISRYGLNEYSAVLHAPLIPRTIHERNYRWYDVSQLSVQDIDMLVIDGPPGFIQQHSRYPALPLLLEYMKDECTVFMDDAARPDEMEVVAMWQTQYRNTTHTYLALERGCAIVQIRRSR